MNLYPCYLTINLIIILEDKGYVGKRCSRTKIAYQNKNNFRGRWDLSLLNAYFNKAYTNFKERLFVDLFYRLNHVHIFTFL